VDDQASVD